MPIDKTANVRNHPPVTALFEWTLVVLAIGVGSFATLALAESCAFGQLANQRSRLAVLAGSAVALLGSAALLKIHSFAHQDAEWVRALARSRGATVIEEMSKVTTMGDAIPSLVIATVVAALVARNGKHTILAWVIPVLVIVELAVQIGMNHVFHDHTIGALLPNVPVGKFGFLPSGSVARLTVIFAVAAWLWHSGSDRRKSWLITLGTCLVIVQALSRIYLGRHLLTDIIGGWSLGLLLAVGTMTVAAFGDRLVNGKSREKHHDAQNVGVE